MVLVIQTESKITYNYNMHGILISMSVDLKRDPDAKIKLGSRTGSIRMGMHMPFNNVTSWF
jgi:hypothetical protein